MQHLKLPLILVAIITSVLLLKYLGIAINLSNSMPIGIYQKFKTSVIKHGDIIALCLPLQIAEQGKAKGYLNHGHCPGDAKPIIKQVIAIPGDDVALVINLLE